LTHGECGFPPDVFGMQRDEVVGVHNSVDEPVENNRQIHVSVETDIDVEPVKLKCNVISTSCRLEKYRF
jgi:hypothetical protein